MVRRFKVILAAPEQLESELNSWLEEEEAKGVGQARLANIRAITVTPIVLSGYSSLTATIYYDATAPPPKAAGL